MSELHVGAHVFLDGSPVTVVAQRYGKVWFTYGHVDYMQLDAEEFKQHCSLARPNSGPVNIRANDSADSIRAHNDSPGESL